jgi:initiation factor 1A
MPKNKTGGNKAKKGPNSRPNKVREYPLPIESENTYISSVSGVMGDLRFKCKLMNKDGYMNSEIMCHLGGRAKKTGRVVANSFVLISTRSFGELKGDIIYVYNSDEVEQLKNKNYIHESCTHKEEEDCDFDFTNDIEENQKDIDLDGI